jgi:RNA polymerase primary sigma factor
MKETSRRGGPGLAAYLLEIQRFPLLTSDQEAQAVARLRNSDGEEEMHRLVQSNLRFVVKIARQYQGRSMPLEDLISLGNLGLLRAARRYEPSRGARFLSCAVWWIRKAMLEALEGGGTHVRVPRYQLQKSVEAYREAGESEGSWDRAKLRSKHLGPRERHPPSPRDRARFAPRRRLLAHARGGAAGRRCRRPDGSPVAPGGPRAGSPGAAPAHAA